MKSVHTQSYKEAGVDIDLGNRFVEIIRKKFPGIGGFSGLYPLGNKYLVASTDGVGTKLKICFAQNRHDTIGRDLVAMCVNDIITTGAQPLFFLDYLATAELCIRRAEDVLSGISEGCKEAECLLLGGETAEMPSFYQKGEYDLAGFAIGLVAREKLIDGAKIEEGDVLVGLTSSGVHSNGFSLVNKIVEESGPPDKYDLLTPTRIYTRDIFEIGERFTIKGAAHITGGGLVENIPRMLPKGKKAHIEWDSWPVPDIFLWLQERGKITDEEMRRVFNMGIGFVIALSRAEARQLVAAKKDCYIIGKI